MKIAFNMKREFCFGVMWLVVVYGFDSVTVNDTTTELMNTDESTKFDVTTVSTDSNGDHITVPKDDNLCNKEKCVRFCSDKGLPNNDFKVEVLHENNQKETIELYKHFKIISGKLPKSTCPFQSKFPFQLTYEGNVLTNYDEVLTNNGELKTYQEYCLRLQEHELIAQICVKPDADADELLDNVNIGIGMLVSVPFLIVTFLVYLFVPELRNLHGKCFLCYLFCLIVSFVPLAIVKINTCQGIPKSLCIGYAYTIYFSWISAFLWTSVISSDLWNSFNDTVKFRYTSDKNLFYLYAIYAWGLSLLLTLFAYVADHNVSVPKFLQPKLGIDTCFITMDKIPRMIFLFMPLCITLLMNIAFFILTALKIHSVKLELSVASCERNQSQPANFHTNKHSFAIYLRLCVIMGLNWIIEGIFMLTDINATFEMVLDMCNALTGVYIFGLFVLKPSVLHLIKKRWQLWFGLSSPSGSIGSFTSWVPPENFVVDVKQR